METDKEQHEPRTGRPTLKTPELCAEICRRISEGETMKAILKTPGMPAWTTVHEWRHTDDSFAQALARAREQQAEIWAEEVKELTDEELPTHEAIGRARLRAGSTLLPAKSSELLVIARYDGLKYPVRHEWSELQRADRKVAECGSLRPQCSTSSLWS